MKIDDSTKTVTITAEDAEFLENWRENSGREFDSIYAALYAIGKDGSLGNSGAATKSLKALKSAESIIIGTEYGKGPSFDLPDGFFEDPSFNVPNGFFKDYNLDYELQRPRRLSVTINSSVTSVGIAAFRHFKAYSVCCKGPAGPGSLIIMDRAFEFSGLRSFEADVSVDLFSCAFANAENLQNVCFRDYVSNVPIECFSDCRALENVSFGIPDAVLNNDYYPDAIKAELYNLSVDRNAFARCESLEKLTFSDGYYISDVGDEAFIGTSLDSLDLSKALFVGKSAFRDSGLDVEASHVGNLKLVESRAFEGCQCPDLLAFSSGAIIADDAFPGNVRVSYYAGDHADSPRQKAASMFSLEEAGSDRDYSPVSV